MKEIIIHRWEYDITMTHQLVITHVLITNFSVMELEGST
jgi:hypothetical protein